MALRVLRIINRFIIGGPAYNVSYLTKYLHPEFETLLVSGQKDDGEADSVFIAENLDLKPLYVNSLQKSLTQPWNDRKAYIEIKKIIEDFKPHIVHTHAAKAGFIGRLVALNCNVPVILHTFHGHYFHSYFSSFKTKTLLNIERYLAKKTDGIIAISPEQYNDLANTYKVATPEKTFTIPLGLDLDRFATDAKNSRQHFRQEFNIDDNTVCIGLIGRIVPIKNHRFFINVIKQIKDISPDANVKFFIIGDGEIRTKIEQYIADNQLNFTTETEKDFTKDIIFTSWRTDMENVLAGLDIIALTSLNEGTPVTLIEAQAASKPIVTTNVGGIQYVVVNDKTAFVVERDDEKSFTQKLLQLINNSDLRSSMGEAGRIHVQNKFSVHRLTNDMKNLYHRLLQEKGVKI